MLLLLLMMMMLLLLLLAMSSNSNATVVAIKAMDAMNAIVAVAVATSKTSIVKTFMVWLIFTNFHQSEWMGKTIGFQDGFSCTSPVILYVLLVLLRHYVRLMPRNDDWSSSHGCLQRIDDYCVSFPFLSFLVKYTSASNSICINIDGRQNNVRGILTTELLWRCETQFSALSSNVDTTGTTTTGSSTSKQDRKPFACRFACQHNTTHHLPTPHRAVKWSDPKELREDLKPKQKSGKGRHVSFFLEGKFTI